MSFIPWSKKDHSPSSLSAKTYTKQKQQNLISVHLSALVSSFAFADLHIFLHISLLFRKRNCNNQAHLCSVLRSVHTSCCVLK